MHILRYQSVSSTNTIALELGSHNGCHGTVVVAETQFGGHGRLDRKWISPPGGLYMSILIEPSMNIDLFPLIPLSVGVAVCYAIEETTGLNPGLKWPNDIFLFGRKTGGILVQSAPYSATEGKIPFVVAGIGINVNSSQQDFPEHLRTPPTSLYLASNKKFNIDLLLNAITTQVLHYMEVLSENRISVITERWQKRDALAGKCLDWSAPGGDVVSGKSLGISKTGQYMIQDEHGIVHHVMAGDIFPNSC